MVGAFQGVAPAAPGVQPYGARRHAALHEQDQQDDGRGRWVVSGERGWWTMSGECFIEALRRAHAGEDPEIVYAEWYANSDVEKPS